MDSSRKTHDDKIKHGMDPNYGLRPADVAKQEAEKRAREEKIKALPKSDSTFFISPIPIKAKKGSK